MRWIAVNSQDFRANFAVIKRIFVKTFSSTLDVTRGQPDLNVSTIKKTQNIVYGIPKKFDTLKNFFTEYNSKFNYFCVKCNTNFDKLKRMHKSCPTCKNKQLLRQCMKCHERFDSYHQTLNHLTNKCFVVRVCPECDQKMDDLDLFERHVQSCGKDSIYNCTTCLFVTDSKDKLRTHMDVHEKQRKKEEIEEKSEKFCFLF